MTETPIYDAVKAELKFDPAALLPRLTADKPKPKRKSREATS